MQTVYLVWSYPAESYDDSAEVVAIYTDRQAAELHVQHAESEQTRILELEGEEYRNAASAWDPEYAGVFKCLRRYTVEAMPLHDHPEQWQDSKKE